jgi:hypothetical protein
MQDIITSAIYRIALHTPACRSSAALLTMRVAALDGVRATAVTADNTLVVMADEAVDLHDELVAAIVRSGLDPIQVRVTTLERLIDPTGLSVETALALGLIAPPREPVRATTVQRVAVHVNGGYNPETIILSAHVPTEIAFSEGHDCLGRVVFDSLDIEADLEYGGALVTLPALEPGTYTFRCGRDVVHGKLIAE